MDTYTPFIDTSDEEPKKINEITIEALNGKNKVVHKSAESKVDDFKDALASLGFKVECDKKNHQEIKISY